MPPDCHPIATTETMALTLRPLITLTTDFGLTDPFVGVMKGVIASICPAAHVIDITHGVKAFDVFEEPSRSGRQGGISPADTSPWNRGRPRRRIEPPAGSLPHGERLVHRAR